LTVPACPVCGGRAFADFNGRRLARCLGCGSLERGRQQWLVLGRLVDLPPGAAIAHFAPERFFLDRFGARTDLAYRAFDKHPEHYSHPVVRVEPLDLCAQNWGLAPASFDLLIHSHVLEHLPCAPEHVLSRMKALLKPGGTMLFCVPIVGDRSIEGLDPPTTPQDKTLRLTQGDHLRIFGRVDFLKMLRRVLGSDGFVPQASLFTDDELRAAAVPIAKREPDGRSAFLYRHQAGPS